MLSQSSCQCHGTQKPTQSLTDCHDSLSQRNFSGRKSSLVITFELSTEWMSHVTAPFFSAIRTPNCAVFPHRCVQKTCDLT
jgi:hypothetical protein